MGDKTAQVYPLLLSILRYTKSVKNIFRIVVFPFVYSSSPPFISPPYNFVARNKFTFDRKDRFDLSQWGFDPASFPAAAENASHCVNLSLGKQISWDGARASWTHCETQASCFNCKRRFRRVIRLCSPRSRGRATSEIKRIFSKMRFLFLPFFSFFLSPSLSLSFSLSFHLPLHLPPEVYREKERVYIRYRRHSVRAQPSYYIRRPHFHLKELWPLWRLLDHSLWSLWKSVVIRLRMRVDRMPCIFYAESCAPSSNYRFREALCHSRRKEMLPRFEEGKICQLTVVFVSSRKYAP